MENNSFYKTWDKKANHLQNKDFIKKNLYTSILRYILPIIIISIFIVIIQWVKIIPEYEIINFDKKNKIYEPDSISKAKLLLKSKNNKPILVQALNTKKDINNSNIILFDKPNGYYRLSDEITIRFNSSDGILYIDQNELKLNKDVEITSSLGTNLKTTNIIYDIENSVIAGQENIILIGNWGKLLGKGFTYKIEESLIILNGRPKLTFINNKGVL